MAGSAAICGWVEPNGVHMKAVIGLEGADFRSWALPFIHCMNLVFRATVMNLL